MIIGAMAAVGLAALSLALAYGGHGEWGGVLAGSVLGLVWITGLWRRWHWLTGAGLFGVAVLAAWGMWLGLPAAWLLAGVIAALAAWDLAHFARRLELPGHPVVNRAALVQAHLQRSGLAVGLGLLLGGIALALTLDLNLGRALLLGLPVIFGLAGLMRLIRRQ